MQDFALATFRSLFSTLYPDSIPSPVHETIISPTGEDAEMTTVEDVKEKKVEEKIVGVAVQVVENSLDEFKEPEKNNAKPAVRILTALIAASGTLPVLRDSVCFGTDKQDFHPSHRSSRPLYPLCLPSPPPLHL
jgi:DNA repair/transcription protein MET18/MMS19